MKRNHDVLHLGLGLEIRAERGLDHEMHLSLDDLGLVPAMVVDDLGLVPAMKMGVDDLGLVPAMKMVVDDLGLEPAMTMVDDGLGLVERGFLAHFQNEILPF